MPRLITPALLLTGLLAVTAPVSPAGAVTLEEVSRYTPVAAYGGVTAWNAYDAASDSYRLRYSVHGSAPQDARLPASRRPYDIDLGPGPGGGLAVVFPRCEDTSPIDCDIWMDNLGSGTPRPVPGASSPSRSEYRASISEDRLIFLGTPPPKYAKRFPVLWTLRVGGSRPARPVTELPHVVCRGRGSRRCQRYERGRVIDFETHYGGIAASYELNRGDTRYSQVLLHSSDGWRQIARTSSGALSSATFFGPSFEPAGLQFAHSRVPGSLAPQIASVRLSGSPRLRELPFTGFPIAVEGTTDGGVALLTQASPESGCTPCSVQRISPPYAPAEPRGYRLAGAER